MNIWLIAAMSANGKIAQSDGQLSLDWTSKEDTRFFIKKTKEAGVVVMGRKTFDTIGKPLKERRIIVMTRTRGNPSLSSSPIGNGGEFFGTVEYTNLQPRQLVAKLEEEGVETVALAGGASVYGAFLAADLVTDAFLTIEPLMFGGGVPLARGFNRVDMKLVQTQALNDQTMLFHYKVLTRRCVFSG